MSPPVNDPFLKPNRPGIRQVIGGAIVVAALLFAWLGRRPEAAPEVLRVSGLAFATVYEVKVVAKGFPPGAAEELQEQINGEILFIDKTLSRFRDDSEISVFNHSKSTEPFRVSKETTSLLEKAQAVSEQTGGAFDVTVGPLVRLWGFHEKKARAAEPDAGVLEKTRNEVGYSGLAVDETSSTLQKSHAALEVDLSAVAKGYAVDRIAGVVEGRGYTNYLVEIGGEIRAKGLNDRKKTWRIGIEKPLAESRETFQIIELKDSAVATSGDYRNFYILDDRRVSHTIDPRTGRPVSHGLASVSVVHPECAVADALATGLTVLGPEDGYALAKKEGLPALFITREKDGTLTSKATPAFERLQASRANTN